MDKDTFEQKKMSLELIQLDLEIERQRLCNENWRIRNKIDAAKVPGKPTLLFETAEEARKYIDLMREEGANTLDTPEGDHSDLPSAPNLDDLKEEVDSDGK